MKVIDKSKMKGGIVVQLRGNNESRGFTIHTDKSVSELKQTLMEVLAKIDDKPQKSQ